MLLLMLLGVGVNAPPVVGIRAYANISFSVAIQGAIEISTVDQGSISITATNTTEGSVS